MSTNHLEKLLYYFTEISAIPRGSGNEAAVAGFIENFAKEHGLECYRDGLNNVLIKAPASPGYEGEPAVLLQGHTDMVCEKNSGTVHDFLTDPLDIYIEDGWMYARGTTLGADNGIAVAAMLTLLDDRALAHPPLECLFTTGEETGMDGARGFDYSKISARRMINLDVEGEGRVTVGCAGGSRTEIKLHCGFVTAEGTALRLKISGLMGGHSGIDISAIRANANKLMGRVLLSLGRSVEYNLVSVRGGLMSNAIPRECEAVIVTRDAAAATRVVERLAADIAAELGSDDADFRLTCSPCGEPPRIMDSEYTLRAASLLACVGNGVIKMSADIPGLVEHSRNLGIVTTDDKGLNLTISNRSAIESQLDESEEYLDAIADLCGAKASHYNRYPGWKYEKDSPLRDKFAAVCRDLLGREAVVEAVHAGLECGIMKAAIPEMDIIAIGPDMENIHTPEERLNIASCGRFMQILVSMLKK